MDIVLRNNTELNEEPIEPTYVVITQRELDGGFANLRLYTDINQAQHVANQLEDHAYVCEVKFLTKYIG